MTPDDWGDAFEEEDEAARDRARRRAEREARRREREDARRSVGERVESNLEGDEVGDAQPGAEPTVEPEPAPAPPKRAATGGASGAIWARRAIAIVVIGVLALMAIGAVALIRRDDAPELKPRPTREVTIPEGYDRAQIAELVKKEGITGDYAKASKSSRHLDLAKYDAKGADSLEGFLFPAQYELYRNASAKDLVAKQLDAFKENFATVDLGYAKERNLTPYDVLIIASMIEEEVQLPKERDDVAAVIYNRLGAGMPLSIDATVRYATGNFDKPLTESELASSSPYNTYAAAGLPPGPISNPGLDSIEAAAKPAQVDYLYYVVKPGTCGEHTFTASEAEFNAAAAAYDEARTANGGKSPDTCE